MAGAFNASLPAWPARTASDCAATSCRRRLIINLPPRHLKSHLASISFPVCVWAAIRARSSCASPPGFNGDGLSRAWPGGQELADKLSRDGRRVVASNWYQSIFPMRLSPRHQVVPEFETTAQGCRIATSVGGVLTGRGADIIIII